MSWASVDDLGDQREKMKAYLEGLAEPIRASGIEVRTEVLSLGDPARNIIDYLKDNPTQLLVMATPGKSRLNRTIFGSVTENVVRMVRVTPLLLVAGGGENAFLPRAAAAERARGEDTCLDRFLTLRPRQVPPSSVPGSLH